MVVLEDMFRRQLSAAQDLYESAKAMYTQQTQLASQQTYTYTTLADTMDYIAENRRRKRV